MHTEGKQARTRKRQRNSLPSSEESLEREVTSVEDLLGELKPTYDDDNVAFETAEMYANDGGRFSFLLFTNAPSRSQEYDEAATKRLATALDQIP